MTDRAKPMAGWKVVAETYSIATADRIEQPMAEVVMMHPFTYLDRRKPITTLARVSMPQYMGYGAWRTLAEVYRMAGAEVVEQPRDSGRRRT